MTVLYEVNEIRMDDPVSFLKQTVGGKKIFGIIIPCSLLQQSVFSVFGIFAFENRKGDLNIGIVHFIISENEVTFQLANPSDTSAIAEGPFYIAIRYFIARNDPGGFFMEVFMAATRIIPLIRFGKSTVKMS